MFQLLQRLILSIAFNLILIITISAQTNNLSAVSDVNIDTNGFHLNPLLRTAFKNPAKANPLLAEFIKPTKYELMYWPNYPLTVQQITARDRKYAYSIGRQIASDIMEGIAENYVNSLLYGKKIPPAPVPKF